jgi:hypothetical protein
MACYRDSFTFLPFNGRKIKYENFSRKKILEENLADDKKVQLPLPGIQRRSCNPRLITWFDWTLPTHIIESSRIHDGV